MYIFLDYNTKNSLIILLYNYLCFVTYTLTISKESNRNLINRKYNFFIMYKFICIKNTYMM